MGVSDFQRVCTEVKDSFFMFILEKYCPHHILSRVLHCKCEKIKIATSPNLTKKLPVPKNETGLAKNKLINRSDSRESSAILGIKGVAFIFWICFSDDAIRYDILNAKHTGKVNWQTRFDSPSKKNNFLKGSS